MQSLLHLARAVFHLAVFFVAGTITSSAMASPRWLHVSGNKILTDTNQIWTAHGANVDDPRSNRGCYPNLSETNPNRTIKLLDTLINQWDATVIRLPLDAAADKGASQSDILGNQAYWAGIKSIIDFVENSNKAYVILTPWLDPTIPRDPNWLPTAATDEIYNKFVDTFGNYSSVIFGVCNEPHDAPDAVIKTAMERAVSVIRLREQQNAAPSHLITVQGNNYTSSLTYYLSNPITSGQGKNIVYEAHMYGFNLLPEIISTSKVIPIFVGEYGPATNLGVSPNDWQACYGDPSGWSMTVAQIPTLQAGLRDNEISYTAWSFSQRNPPNMLLSSPRESLVNNCPVICNPNSPLPGFTSFGQAVYDDLRKPYRNKKIIAAINAALD